jgi:hypothetical protein
MEKIKRENDKNLLTIFGFHLVMDFMIKFKKKSIKKNSWEENFFLKKSLKIFSKL